MRKVVSTRNNHVARLCAGHITQNDVWVRLRKKVLLLCVLRLPKNKKKTFHEVLYHHKRSGKLYYLFQGFLTASYLFKKVYIEILKTTVSKPVTQAGYFYSSCETEMVKVDLCNKFYVEYNITESRSGILMNKHWFKIYQHIYFI